MRIVLLEKRATLVAENAESASFDAQSRESASSVFPSKAQRFKPSPRFSRNKRRGAAAVEFAFVAPLLFLLVLGLIEFGRVMMVQHMLTNGAREGARKAVLANSTESEVNTTVDNYMSSAGISGHTTTINPGLSSANAGDPITVRVRVPYSNVSWLAGAMGSSSILGANFNSIKQLNSKTLEATVVMRREANNN